MTLLLSEKQTLKCTVEPEDAYAKQHARRMLDSSTI